ncbi:hypothetical protein V1477_021184 [Vespula maculifrons]|uniref:Uncharacterized protein n=1 Tax=Vespula maculifrons TaxID=7453 RepID=A0ABD2AJ59_VESMC
MNKIRILQSKVVESIRLSAGDETLVHFVSSRLSSKFLRSPEEETPRIIYKFSICHDNGNHLLKQDPLVRHSCKAQLLTEGYGTIFATYLTVDGFDVYATARELPFLGMQRKTDIVTNTVNQSFFDFTRSERAPFENLYLAENKLKLFVLRRCSVACNV